MKWFFKNVLIGVTILVLAGLGFVLMSHARGRSALQLRLNELAARGEKLNLAGLIPPPVSTNQNAALDLAAFTNILKTFDYLGFESPPVMKLVGTGHAVASWQIETWAIDDKRSNSWSEFGPKIAGARPALEGLKSIWSKPDFDDGYDYRKGYLDSQYEPLFVEIKQTAMLLSAVVSDDLRRHDAAAATGHLHSMLALVKCLEGRKLLISQLIRIACARITWYSTWEALQTPDWTEEQLAGLQAVWQANEFIRSMSDALAMERDMNLELFNQLRISQNVRTKFIHSHPIT